MREALRVVLYQGLTFGLQVVFMLLAARMLGPEMQGRYAILRTCTYLIETFMWLGLTSGVTYFVAKDFDRYHGAMVLSSAAYIACGIVVSIPLIIFVLPRFQVPAATGFLIVIWVVSLGLSQLFLKIFLGQRRYDLFNCVNILTACALFVPFLFFWIFGRITLQNIVFCNIAANLVGLSISVIAHRGYLRSLRVHVSALRGLVVEFYAIGWKGYLSSLAFQALYRADFFFVGFFLGARVLGIYSLAVFVIEAIQKVPDWLGMVLAPKVSAGLDPEGKVTQRFALGACTFVIMIAGVLGAAGLARFHYLVMALGSKYQGVELIVLALMPKAIIHGMLAIYGGNLAGKGYTMYHPLAGMVSLATLVVLDSLLFHWFGISAAIFGITGAYCVATAILMIGAHQPAKVIRPAFETVGV